MRLPNHTQRLFICGHTGSGKSVAAVWHLSEQNYDEMPWICFDFKGEELFTQIPYIQEIGVGHIPKKSGVYVTRPLLDKDDDALEEMLWNIWKRGNIGVYIDEGYMIPRRSVAMKALLTQGRSKHIPMITLTQRPKQLPTQFIISEADFYQVFALSDWQDMERVVEFIRVPDGVDIEEDLPEYWSWYYDVGKKKLQKLKPVPAPTEIMKTFEERLQPRKFKLL